MDRGYVLVVDDEANARRALAELLQDEGYQVETAADGWKALDKLKQGQPDIVLTDLKMAGMDGLELLRTIRAQDNAAVVVVMTAFGAAETAAAVMKAGASDYLTKPINMVALVQVLERQMERLRPHRSTFGVARALHPWKP